MKRTGLLLAGLGMFALANVAAAEEPMTLTDAQLDGVTAGSYWCCANASVSFGMNTSNGQGSTDVSGYVIADPYGWSKYASASMSANTTVYGGSVQTYTSVYASVYDY